MAMTMDRPVRPELLKATDEEIEDAVKYADPMVLRGLVYQLLLMMAACSSPGVSSAIPLRGWSICRLRPKIRAPRLLAVSGSLILSVDT